MSKKTATILITALLSSLIFLLIVSAGMDFIFMFLATLPLFAVGLNKDPKIVLKAGALATIPIALITGSASLVMVFFLVFALPAWYICDMALHYYDLKLNNTNTPMPTLRLWYPMGLITVHLAVYACSILALITAFFATQDVNLPQQITLSIQDEMVNLGKTYDINVDVTSKDITFMICGVIAWIWEIVLLAHSWVINRSLVRRKLGKRPSMMITPFPAPNWLLSLMTICALASLIGGESMRFLGKASLIILMLPYFFQGAAIININTISWHNRRFLLFFIYLTTALLFWPALVIAGIGLWDHLKILNKHLSSSGTSSKS